MSATQEVQETAVPQGPPPLDQNGLRVVEDKCEQLGTNNVKIIVECATIDIALGTKAKEMAILGARQMGMFRAGISGQSGPYPVDEYGNDCTLSAQPGMRYRNDFSLSGGLGG